MSPCKEIEGCLKYAAMTLDSDTIQCATCPQSTNKRIKA